MGIAYMHGYIIIQQIIQIIRVLIMIVNIIVKMIQSIGLIQKWQIMKLQKEYMYLEQLI